LPLSSVYVYIPVLSKLCARLWSGLIAMIDEIIKQLTVSSELKKARNIERWKLKLNNKRK
jgi:hypothetical protein